MSIDMIRKIAEYLQVSVDYLVSGTEHQPIYLKENEVKNYVNANDELWKEIIRISGTLNIKNRTKLLAYAYELESTESK